LFPDGKLDLKANKAIEEGFKEWAVTGIPDVTGLHSWRSIQRMYLETIAKDGECFIRRHKGWGRNAFRYALEFIDAEAIDRNLTTDLGDGRCINMGIELDKWRRPVAYYVITRSPTSDVYEYQGRRYLRIPAEEMIHGFLPESILQTRGFPWLAVSLMRSQMLHGYEEAELVAARVASAKMGFFETDPEKAGPEEYEGDKDSSGAELVDAEPGTFEDLDPGKKFVAFDPQHPSSAFDSFVKANLRGMASGLGVSYHTMANDLKGVNYSSGRLGALEDRELYKELQTFLIETLIQPVVIDDWLPLALLSGRLNIGGTPLKSSRLSKYKRIHFQGRRWSWVDPKKDLEGYGIALDRRLQSPQQVIRERGDDPEEILDQWAEWERMKADRGIKEADPKPPTPDDTEDENQLDDEEGSDNGSEN
jgi:lambda family phage portal protein